MRAFAHFADSRVVLKVEKSELLAFCLLSLVKPNPFSHSSASEQSVQILPSCPLLFQAMLSLSALPSPCLVSDTPSLAWVCFYQLWWCVFRMWKAILRSRSCYLITQTLGGSGF